MVNDHWKIQEDIEWDQSFCYIFINNECFTEILEENGIRTTSEIIKLKEEIKRRNKDRKKWKYNMLLPTFGDIFCLWSISHRSIIQNLYSIYLKIKQVKNL